CRYDDLISVLVEIIAIWRWQASLRQCMLRHTNIVSVIYCVAGLPTESIGDGSSQDDRFLSLIISEKYVDGISRSIPCFLQQSCVNRHGSSGISDFADTFSGTSGGNNTGNRKPY